MQKIKITGIGTCLPGEKITNDIIAAKFSIDQEWIELFIGTKSRYFSTDLHTGKVCHSLTDLCTVAANKAIQNAGITPETIDAIILATATPDNLMPSTATLVMDRLNLNNKEVYQLQSGCSGAIQALNLGYDLIKTGFKSTVLVIGGDVCNKFLNLKEDFSKLPTSELINYVLFGDGAGAAILSNDKNMSGVTIENILLRCVGKDIPPAQVIDWHGKQIEKNLRVIFEDYKAIEKLVPVLAKDVLDAMLVNTNWGVKDVNYLLPPQLSKVMTDSIVKSLDISSDWKVINVVEETGNNGNALPFLQIEKLLQSINPGEKAIAVAVESSKWIKSGVALYA